METEGGDKFEEATGCWRVHLQSQWSLPLRIITEGPAVSNLVLYIKNQYGVSRTVGPYGKRSGSAFSAEGGSLEVH